MTFIKTSRSTLINLSHVSQIEEFAVPRGTTALGFYAANGQQLSVMPAPHAVPAGFVEIARGDRPLHSPRSGDVQRVWLNHALVARIEPGDGHHTLFDTYGKRLGTTAGLPDLTGDAQREAA